MLINVHTTRSKAGKENDALSEPDWRKTNTFRIREINMPFRVIEIFQTMKIELFSASFISITGFLLHTLS